jgi:dynein heavy chain
VSEVIEQWLIVQNMWMYMEAVFSGGDIVKQLPQEAKRFQNIDKNYMKVGCSCWFAGCVQPLSTPATLAKAVGAT